MLSIKFADGEIIKEPNLDWNSIPNNIVIRYMDYTIGKKTIRLMGYERYLRLKEIAKGLNVPINGISKIILVGATGGMGDKVTIDFINNKITKKHVSIDEVYNNQSIADNLWKSGQILDNPNIYERND